MKRSKWSWIFHSLAIQWHNNIQCQEWHLTDLTSLLEFICRLMYHGQYVHLSMYMPVVAIHHTGFFCYSLFSIVLLVLLNMPQLTPAFTNIDLWPLMFISGWRMKAFHHCLLFMLPLMWWCSLLKNSLLLCRVSFLISIKIGFWWFSFCCVMLLFIAVCFYLIRLACCWQ